MALINRKEYKMRIKTKEVKDNEKGYARLERQVEILKFAVLGLAVVLLAVLTMALKDASSDKILRIQGLIIEDGDRNPRILIGAPFPGVKERHRSDSTTGLVLLDEKGIDRLSFGYPALAPQVKGQVSERITTHAGFIVNDTDGDERTGYGVTDMGHVILGMDYKGREALILMVDPKGYTGVLINGEKSPPHNQRVFLGTNNKPGSDHGILVLNDSQGTARTMFHLDEGQMRWKLFDQEGNIVGDAAGLLKK